MEYDLVYQGNLVEVFKVSDCFYFRRANLPVRNQCNGAFIVGEREVAIVDAPPGGIEMIDEAERLFHKPVTSLFITHAHGDHSEGLPSFLDRDLTVYCNYRILDRLSPRGRACRAAFAGVHDSLDLRLSGGVEVELFILNDTAHSKGDMFVRAQDVLCAGDAVVEYQTAYFHGADIHSWIYSLGKLAAVKGKYILPGHSPELLPWSYIGDFAAHLEAVKKCAEACFERFRSEGGAVKDRHVTTGDVKNLVDAFFDEAGGDALLLEERAGKKDARREVRMVLWSFMREVLR